MKVGIRGAGVGQRLHAPAWELVRNCSIEFLERERSPSDFLDLIIIAVPPTHQLEELERLSAFSRCFLVEKPFGPTVHAFNAWAARRAPVERPVVLINYQLRFLMEIARLQSSEALACANRITVTYRSSARCDKRLLPNWQLSHATRGGVFWSVFPHLVDLVLFLGAKNISVGAVSTGHCMTEPMLGSFDTLALQGVASFASGNKDLLINIDLCGDTDDFRIELANGKVFETDLLRGASCCIPGQPMCLSSRGPGPWHSAYRFLIDELQKDLRGTDLAPGALFAKPDDALAVHKILESTTALARTT